MECKANLEGIEVRYLTVEETKNTSKTCHRCGHAAKKVKERTFKCEKCGMEYDGD
ncbi:transposase [Candidatus Bathyarchaeota archaeon]|nr:transposase [Candidatus Bathyarchaeota archaeon]